MIKHAERRENAYHPAIPCADKEVMLDRSMHIMQAAGKKKKQAAS